MITNRLLLPLVTVAALLVGAPAQAATNAVRDAKGDMVAYDGSVTSAPDMRVGDLTRLATKHAKTRLTLTTTFAEGPASNYWVGWTVVTPKRTYRVQDIAFFASEGVAVIERGDFKRFECRGLKLSESASRKTIALTVPRRCLGNPAWVRTGVLSQVVVDDQMYVDDGRSESLDPDKVTLGPKVRVG